MIIGSNKTSWIVGYPSQSPSERNVFRLPRKAFAEGQCPENWALNTTAIDELDWVQRQRPLLVKSLQTCRSVNVLRTVAKALSHKLV